MLAMDIAELPVSYLASIKETLSFAPEPLEPARILSFVLTKNQRASAFQRTMMIAARTTTGSLATALWPINWSVGGQVVGDSLTGLNVAEEEDRLNYLLHLVINQDGALLHGVGLPPENLPH